MALMFDGKIDKKVSLLQSGIVAGNLYLTTDT
jgi:hypothetical protein